MDVWQRSEYTCGFEYARVLVMPPVVNMLGFWIYQDSEYASSSEYVKVWTFKGSEYARMTQGSEYAWIIPGYVW